MNDLTIPPLDDDANARRERNRLAALAEQTLTFRRSACDTLDELLIEMIRGCKELGWNKFTTPNGRPCILALGIGSDAVATLTDAVYALTHPHGETD